MGGGDVKYECTNLYEFTNFIAIIRIFLRIRKFVFMLPKLEDVKIAVVGLGYVGLPLALALGKERRVPVYGFDTNAQRVGELQKDVDRNAEYSADVLRASAITYSADPTILRQANFFIIAVPTPINKAKQPDLVPVEDAAEIVGKHLQKGSVVVLESTVYPGVTEEVMVPIIERVSGLKYGKDWKAGYSPERINPGDHEHSIDKVIKIVSGMDQETLDLVAAVYGIVCSAGVHRAPNIKTAEAAKVIENVQRDLNIALVNELALIFHRIGITTNDVLEAAGTKWNFHKYKPGLVGGHCIGVDPYYLTQKAEELGYHPQVILAGRRINDSMAEYVAELMVRGLIEAGKVVQKSRVLVLGLTFKEDIRDTRNSKIEDTIVALQSHGITVLGHDPLLTKAEVESFGVVHVADPATMEKVDGVILATAHQQFKALSLQSIMDYFNGNGDGRGVFVDVKSWFLSALRATSPRSLIYKCL